MSNSEQSINDRETLPPPPMPDHESLAQAYANRLATLRRWASVGGKASQASGRGHRWTPEQAREMARKGGQASQAARRAARQ